MITIIEKESLLRKAILNVPFPGLANNCTPGQTRYREPGYRLAKAKEWEVRVQAEYLILFFEKTEGYTRGVSRAFLALNPTLDMQEIDPPWLDRILLNSWNNGRSDDLVGWVMTRNNDVGLNNVKTIKCRPV